MSERIAFVLNLDSSFFPFIRAPFVPFNNQTLLDNTIRALRALNLLESQIFALVVDDETQTLVSNFELEIVRVEKNWTLFSEMVDQEKFVEFDIVVIVNLWFPDYDFKLVERVVQEYTISNEVVLMGSAHGSSELINSNSKVIARILFNRTDYPGENLGVKTFMVDSVPWSVQTLKDLHSISLLKRRRRIVINVEAYSEIGMGHIFRCLSIASYLSDYEIIFVCTKRSRIVSQLASASGYQVKMYDGYINPEALNALQPDLVINDILNTDDDYIRSLRKFTKVLNFEDLGHGSKFSDLTINDLYPKQNDHPNILWGHGYYFLRDEFETALPILFKSEVENLLITFGGTDPSNLTLEVLNAIEPLLEETDIHVNVVTGAGYSHLQQLKSYLEISRYRNIKHWHQTGIMSKIMERTDLAICSNGRTTYELAQMHIPSIIICHHEREALHSFASEENGFINLGVYNRDSTMLQTKHYLSRLIEDNSYRKSKFDKMSNFDFRKNKLKIIEIIKNLVEGK